MHRRFRFREVRARFRVPVAGEDRPNDRPRPRSLSDSLLDKVVVVDHFFAVCGSKRLPHGQVDFIADELDVPVAEERMDAAGVIAPRRALSQVLFPEVDSCCINSLGSDWSKFQKLNVGSSRPKAL